MTIPPMIALVIPRGETLPNGEFSLLPPGIASVCHLERGLCIQQWTMTDTTVGYGITHHSGYIMSKPAFDYQEARFLQLALLDLPIDWTLPSDHPSLAVSEDTIREAVWLIDKWTTTYGRYDVQFVTKCEEHEETDGNPLYDLDGEPRQD